MSSADNICKHLDSDQVGKNIRPDLNPRCLTLLLDCIKMMIMKKNQQMTRNMQNFPTCKEFGEDKSMEDKWYQCLFFRLKIYIIIYNY